MAEATGNLALDVGGLESLDRTMMESYSGGSPIKIGGIDQASAILALVGWL